MSGTKNPEKESRNWAMFCHLAALSVYIGIPLGNILGPLIIWIIKKDEFPLVMVHGKMAINFQISMTIYAIVSLLLVMVLIGFPLLFAVGITDLVFIIISAVKTNKGESFKYPLTIQFLK